VTNPLWFTVATAALLVDHVTPAFVAFTGETVFTNCTVPPGTIVSVVLSRLTFVTNCTTVTVQLSVRFPSTVVAVTVVVPAVTAITRPEAVTVATAALLLAQLTFWFVAFAGLTVAASCSEYVGPATPITITVALLFRLTPVTGTFCAVTVTLHEPVFPPSTVVTVIRAVPALTPVTSPLLPTVATEALLELQLTFWLVAVDGLIVATRSSVPPTRREVLAFRLTLLTGTVTVTTQLAVFPPSAVVTVIVVVPPERADTIPLEETEATPETLDCHVTARLLAFDGVNATTNCSVPPAANDSVVLFRLTPVTGTVTVTVQLAVFPPSAVVTVIRIVPALTPVTVPSLATVATAALPVDQLTA
jgi:hypothetical protein